MHRALWTLTRLCGKASFRRLLRGAKTVRGAIVLLVVVVALGFWSGTAVVMTFVLRGSPETTRYAGTAAPYLTLILLALFLQTVLGRGSGAMLLSFSPAEVDFLFPGPFHRRDLLLFKLFRRGLGVVAMAFAFSVTPVLIFFGDWLAMFVGLTLALAFMILASLAAALARLIVSEAAHTRARKLVLLAVTGLAAAALPRTFSGARVLHFADLAMSFRSTWPGRVLLAPFEIFSGAMLAERWFPDLLGWAAAGTAIDLGLLALVLRLDADYLEWSTSISQWAYEMRQRARRGGGLAVASVRTSLRFRIPPLSWMGGAGPIAWRQLVQASRAWRGTIVMGLSFTIGILVFHWYFSTRSPGAVPSGALPVGLLSYFTFMFVIASPMAFRGDLDQLDFLKTLPVGPLAMAAGQLVGCAVVIAAFQLAILGIFAVATATVPGTLLAAAVLVLPVDLILLAAGNLAFLIYPVRTSTPASFDVNSLGRGFLSFLLQMIFLVPLLGVAAGLAAAVYLSSGSSLAAAVVTALLVLLIELAPMLVLVGQAFDRFDPATEIPA